MDEKTFLEKMTDLLDLEETPKLDEELSEFENWDSLGYITFLSMANKVSKERVNSSLVQQAKTLNDLFALVKKG